MDLQAAASHARPMAQVFRAFEKLEEVLRLAATAEQGRAEVEQAAAVAARRVEALGVQVREGEANLVRLGNEAAALKARSEQEHRKQVLEYRAEHETTARALRAAVTVSEAEGAERLNELARQTRQRQKDLAAVSKKLVEAQAELSRVKTAVTRL